MPSTSAGIQKGLTPQQIADAGAAAGMSGNHLKIMVAIARAESGGNARAHNSTPPDDSYGLWQINMLGSMGPARRRQFGISSNSQLFDPVTNAKAAQSIYKSQGYKAWSVYNSGSYRKYLDSSIASGGLSSSETMQPSEDPNITAAHQLSFDLFGIRETIRGFTEKSREFGVLFLLFIIALVLLILGIILINKDGIGKLVGMTGAGKAGKLSKVLT